MTLLAPTLQAYFTDRLLRQRQASPHTITAYRRAWRLLVAYAAEQAGKAPSMLDIGDLDAALIAGFLNHLEAVRHNTVRTRNARLAAIHSLFAYAALEHPEHAGDIARVLAIPAKKFDSTLVTHLTEPEITALLGSPHRRELRYPATPSSTWSPGTPPPRHGPAPRCRPRRSPRTPCGTPRP